MVLKFGIILIAVMYCLRISIFKKRKSLYLGIFILILVLMTSMSEVSWVSNETLFDKRYSTVKLTDFRSPATNFWIFGTRKTPIRHIIIIFRLHRSSLSIFSEGMACLRDNHSDTKSQQSSDERISLKSDLLGYGGHLRSGVRTAPKYRKRLKFSFDILRKKIFG